MSTLKLVQGDCLEVMKQIPDKSVDLVLCDLPYNTIACKWDNLIPLDKLWEQYERIGTDICTFVLFGSEPFSTRLRMSNLNKYKYDWIWKKPTMTGFQHAKNMPLKNFETISVFSNGSMGHANLLKERRMIYNPQGIIPINKIKKAGKNQWGNIAGKRPSQKSEYLSEYTNYPSMVLEFSKDGKLHPTQKPVALLEYLIRTYTNENMTVLDNTMGSGSTMVACQNTNRNGIGIELDEVYFKIALDRTNITVQNEKTITGD